MAWGQEVKLSPTECRLLHCLAANAGRVLTQEELLEKLWGGRYHNKYEALRMHISRLRQKIEKDPHKPEYILTRPGMGYMLATPAGVDPCMRVEGFPRVSLRI